MNTRPLRRTFGAVIGSALAGTLLMLPVTTATAAPQTTTAATQECQVTGGTLQWGVKESFRSYISGSIANGGWETTGGVTYDTPNFSWTGARGTIDPGAGTGAVSFEGGVHFTGHDGVLDLTFENPTIEFEGEGKAALMLDARSTDMEGNVTVDSKQEWVGEVVSPEHIVPEGGTVKLEALATTLTNSGAVAFAGFYEAEQKLDPLTLELTVTGCATPQNAPTPEASPEAPAQPEQTKTPEASVPWAPIIVGGVALVVIALTTGILIGGRKRANASQDISGGEDLPPATDE